MKFDITIWPKADLEVETLVAEVKFRHHHFNPPIEVAFKSNSPKHKSIHRLVKAHTRCEIRLAGVKIAVGGAWCSVHDTFDYDKGRKLAMQKAMNKTALGWDARRQFWSGMLWGFEREQILDNMLGGRQKNGSDQSSGKEEGNPTQGRFQGSESSAHLVLELCNDGEGVPAQQALSHSEAERSESRPGVDSASRPGDLGER